MKRATKNFLGRLRRCQRDLRLSPGLNCDGAPYEFDIKISNAAAAIGEAMAAIVERNKEFP